MITGYILFILIYSLIWTCNPDESDRDTPFLKRWKENIIFFLLVTLYIAIMFALFILAGLVLFGLLCGIVWIITHMP
jgi:hypothetical protein